jgi:hypothetical protein
MSAIPFRILVDQFIDGLRIVGLKLPYYSKKGASALPFYRQTHLNALPPTFIRIIPVGKMPGGRIEPYNSMAGHPYRIVGSHVSKTPTPL